MARSRTSGRSPYRSTSRRSGRRSASRRRGRGRGGGGFREAIGLLAVFVVAIVLVVVGRHLADALQGDLDPPTSATVYLVDTSGNQALDDPDTKAAREATQRRIEREARTVLRERGVLVVTNFANDANGVRKYELDLSEEALECSGGAACDGYGQDRLEEEKGKIAAFLASLTPSGGTDVVNAAFVNGAGIASTAAGKRPSRLVIESDFVETVCEGFGTTVSQWPPVPEAARNLAKCVRGEMDLGALEEVVLVGVQLANGVSTADIGRATETFLAFCRNKGGQCRPDA